MIAERFANAAQRPNALEPIAGWAQLCALVVLVAGMLHGCASRPVAGSLVSSDRGRCVYVSTEGEGYFTRPAPCADRVRE